MAHYEQFIHSVICPDGALLMQRLARMPQKFLESLQHEYPRHVPAVNVDGIRTPCSSCRI